MTTLKRTITSRVETIVFGWIRKYQDYGVHKECRDRMKMSTPKTCFWCHRKFVASDETYLTSVDGKGNKLVCTCCAELIDNDSTEQVENKT